jgi:hypothetical protein
MSVVVVGYGTKLCSFYSANMVFFLKGKSSVYERESFPFYNVFGFFKINFF